MKRVPKQIEIDGVLYEVVHKTSSSYNESVRQMTSKDFDQFDDIVPTDIGDSYICKLDKKELYNHEGDVTIILAELIDPEYPEEGGPVGIRVYLGSKKWERTYANNYRRAFQDFKNVSKWVLEVGLRSAIKEFKLRRV